MTKPGFYWKAYFDKNKTINKTKWKHRKCEKTHNNSPSKPYNFGSTSVKNKVKRNCSVLFCSVLCWFLLFLYFPVRNRKSRRACRWAGGVLVGSSEKGTQFCERMLWAWDRQWGSGTWVGLWGSRSLLWSVLCGERDLWLPILLVLRGF